LCCVNAVVHIVVRLLFLGSAVLSVTYDGLWLGGYLLGFVHACVL
jgi:hypothetical protein